MPRHNLEDVAKVHGFTLPLAPEALAGLMTTVLRSRPSARAVALQQECPDCLFACDCLMKHLGRPCRRYQPDFDIILLDWKPWQVK